jgi:hypothetical protein
MFYSPGLIFGGAKCVGSRFLVLRTRLIFGGTRLIFGGTKGDGSRLHVLRGGTSFWR